MSVSIEHEAPIELCHRHPQLVLKLLGLLGHAVPPDVVAEPQPANFNQPVVEQWQSDGAMLLKIVQQPVGAVALEIQRKPDPAKRLSWPVYTAALHAKHGGIDTYLLVIATNRPTAQWARQPIKTCQPHASFVPLVVGPDELPRVESVEAALADLPLAMLSALLHVSDDHGEIDAGHALRAAQARAGSDVVVWFYGLLRGIVDDEKLTLLQEIIKMLDPWANFQPRTKWERESFSAGISEGEAKGEAKALLRVLMARSLPLADDQRRRIEQCQDVQQLERWIERALSARSAAEVLGD